MKALCPLLFFIISTPLWSQPQLEFVSDFVSPVNMTIYNFEEAIPMPDTGENIIWDYSSYNITSTPWINGITNSGFFLKIYLSVTCNTRRKIGW